MSQKSGLWRHERLLILLNPTKDVFGNSKTTPKFAIYAVLKEQKKVHDASVYYCIEKNRIKNVSYSEIFNALLPQILSPKT
jgi:hypothetical protein